MKEAHHPENKRIEYPYQSIYESFYKGLKAGDFWLMNTLTKSVALAFSS